MKRTAISPLRAFSFDHAILGVALLLLGASAAAQDDPFREVRDALKRAEQLYKQPLNGVQWTKMTMMGATDHPVYQIQGTNERGNKVEVEINRAGRVIEVEEHGIPMSEVPAVVLDRLRREMPLFHPSVIEAIYQAGMTHPVCYGFEGEGADGIKIEVYLSADGKTFWN